MSAVGGAKPTRTYSFKKSLIAFSAKNIFTKQEKNKTFKLKYCQPELVKVGAI
jgi:hypothetical protein